MIFPSLYEELDMVRYADLVTGLLPEHDLIIALYDDSGQLVWSNIKVEKQETIIVKNNNYLSTNMAGEICNCSEYIDKNEKLACFNLGYLAGRSAGDLIFYDVSNEIINSDGRDSIISMLCNIAEIIKAELGYLYEVNSMATELGERYDELSMLRTSDLAMEEYQESRHIFSTYIRSCAEHLNVDYAAIWIVTGDEIYPGGVSYEHGTSDILNLLKQLSKNAFEMFKDGHDGFGINDKDEALRQELGLPVDKKVLLVPVNDVHGKPRGVLSCLNEFYNKDFRNSDKSTLEAVSQKTYKYLSSTQDEVTGLLNRKGFEESVWRDIFQSDDEQYLVLFNINQFKVVNAAYGSTAGDKVLSAVAEVISNPDYKLKYAARLEADQFSVLIKSSNNDVENFIFNICKAIDATTVSTTSKQFSVKIRAGVIALNSKETALTDHIYAAEMALLSAKEEAKQVVLYKPGNTALIKRKHQLTQVENIRAAIEEDRFELYCQRIQPLSGDELHYEILVRMVDEIGELVPPDDFIPIAERFELMSIVDRWILEHTFMILSREEYREIAANCKWGINLSGMTIGEADFHHFVSDCLNRYEILPTNVYFEITETAAIKNFHNCTTFMNNIHSIGVQFALDDFGSGLSSFSYLKKLSIDYLKIDGSLVKDIVNSKLDQTMVASIADIAKVLNVKTIAEYVENDEILDVLSNMEIDYAQGYGIMKPQPLEIELQKLSEYPEKKMVINR
jgi:diguanylate cyclase (GGDEF)-like protein